MFVHSPQLEFHLLIYNFRKENRSRLNHLLIHNPQIHLRFMHFNKIANIL